MQAAVHTMVQANCTMFRARWPQRRGNDRGRETVSTCWFTGNPCGAMRRRMMPQRRLQSKRRSAQLVAPERRPQRTEAPQEAGEAGIAAREPALAQLEFGDEEAGDDAVVEQVGEP